MMYSLNALEDVKNPHYTRDKTGNKHSDEIYTFDIETTSLFNINGEWKVFDDSIPQKSDKKHGIIGYDHIDKAACCYHCQFSVNDKVYRFRELSQFEDVLKKISNPFLRKYVFIHNASFEFQWLIPILKKYTIVDMVAREVRKPIKFVIQELNIEIRCSYMLTNLSLDKASKNYTEVQKAKGDLDYNVARSPLTPLTEKEEYYCEMDCICLYHIIKYFRKEYGHLMDIPLTQTGEVRRAYKKLVPFYHFDYVRSLVPSVEEYKILRRAFMGGITHGNALWVKQYLLDKDGNGVKSADISSSYPFSLISEKYPCERFRKVSPELEKYYSNDKFAKIYKVRLTDVRAKMYNHYISNSHCDKKYNEVSDNGRIVKADLLEMIITEIDLEMIEAAYSFKLEKLEVWVSKKDYLPKYFIEFILDLYGKKTTLKGQTSEDGYIESIYMKSKQQINSLFGAAVTDLISASCVFTDHWIVSKITDEFMQLKLDEEKERYPLFWYSAGVYCTAFSRRNLFQRLIDNNYELDFDVVYYDTDSLKILNMDDHVHIFNEYNEAAVEKLWKMCIHYNIPFSKCEPKDNKGNKHLIGEFDLHDGDYTEFITLGAKRYCYRDREDGKLHMTVSGVNKAAVDSLNDDIRNFNENAFFGYKEAKKNIVTYIDHQEPFTFKDVNGIEYQCAWDTGICLYPTTYSMSINPTFDDFIHFLMHKKSLDEQNNFIPIYRKYNTKKR